MTNNYVKKLIEHTNELVKYSKDLEIRTKSISESDYRKWVIFMHKLNLLVGFILALEHIDVEDVQITSSGASLELPNNFEALAKKII